VAVITYLGNGFSLLVPADWDRLATVNHVAVFLGPAADGIRSSISLSRFAGRADGAAESARVDHGDRYHNYEILFESPGIDSFYRRYTWKLNETRILQHQLFAPGLLLTCSRAGSLVADEKAFRKAIASLRVGTNPVSPLEERATRQ